MPWGVAMILPVYALYYEGRGYAATSVRRSLRFQFSMEGPNQIPMLAHCSLWLLLTSEFTSRVA